MTSVNDAGRLKGIAAVLGEIDPIDRSRPIGFRANIFTTAINSRVSYRWVSYETDPIVVNAVTNELVVPKPHIWVPKLSLADGLALGAAAAIIKNPIVTRRFWAGWGQRGMTSTGI